MLFRILATVTVALTFAGGAAAQPTPAGPTASCDYGGAYGVHQGPAYGWIHRQSGGFRADVYVAPGPSSSPVGDLMPEAANQGFLHLELTSPTLQLTDPGLRIQTLAMQPRSVIADGPPPRWRVRLVFDAGDAWYGPGDHDEVDFTTTSYSIYPRGGVEPYLRLIDRGNDTPATDVYRRLVQAGRVTVEFHTPPSGLRAGRLFVSTEMSLTPLAPLLDAARAHFAACDAAES